MAEPGGDVPAEVVELDPPLRGGARLQRRSGHCAARGTQSVPAARRAARRNATDHGRRCNMRAASHGKTRPALPHAAHGACCMTRAAACMLPRWLRPRRCALPSPSVASKRAPTAGSSSRATYLSAPPRLATARACTCVRACVRAPYARTASFPPPRSSLYLSPDGFACACELHVRARAAHIRTYTRAPTNARAHTHHLNSLGRMIVAPSKSTTCARAVRVRVRAWCVRVRVSVRARGLRASARARAARARAARAHRRLARERLGLRLQTNKHARGAVPTG
jgi:hypothetical protein